jgi:hypothetical protein
MLNLSMSGVDFKCSNRPLQGRSTHSQRGQLTRPAGHGRVLGHHQLHSLTHSLARLPRGRHRRATRPHRQSRGGDQPADRAAGAACAHARTPSQASPAAASLPPFFRHRAAQPAARRPLAHHQVLLLRLLRARVSRLRARTRTRPGARARVGAQPSSLAGPTRTRSTPAAASAQCRARIPFRCGDLGLASAHADAARRTRTAPAEPQPCASHGASYCPALARLVFPRPRLAGGSAWVETGALHTSYPIRKRLCFSCACVSQG